MGLGNKSFDIWSLDQNFARRVLQAKLNPLGFEASPYFRGPGPWGKYIVINTPEGFTFTWYQSSNLGITGEDRAFIPGYSMIPSQDIDLSRLLEIVVKKDFRSSIIQSSLGSNQYRFWRVIAENPEKYQAVGSIEREAVLGYEPPSSWVTRGGGGEQDTGAQVIGRKLILSGPMSATEKLYLYRYLSWSVNGPIHEGWVRTWMAILLMSATKRRG